MSQLKLFQDLVMWKGNNMKKNFEKEKRLTVIDKSDIMTCWTCNGEGSIIINENHPLVRERCTVCDGTGKYRESHYIYVDEKNKIAMDSDCGA